MLLFDQPGISELRASWDKSGVIAARSAVDWVSENSGIRSITSEVWWRPDQVESRLIDVGDRQVAYLQRLRQTCVTDKQTRTSTAAMSRGHILKTWKGNIWKIYFLKRCTIAHVGNFFEKSLTTVLRITWPQTTVRNNRHGHRSIKIRKKIITKSLKAISYLKPSPK